MSSSILNATVVFDMPHIIEASNVIHLKLSQAREIWRKYRGTLPTRNELEEYEGYYTACLIRPYCQVIVLRDENTGFETRPLLVEDCVQQSIRRQRAAEPLLAMVSDTSIFGILPTLEVIQTKQGAVEFCMTTFNKRRESSDAKLLVPYRSAQAFAETLNKALNGQSTT